MATPFQHLVVLMLENRSFDHMLGFLKSPAYPIEGLDGTETNFSAIDGAPPVQVSPDARTVHDLSPDPGHEFLNANIQIFGNGEGIDSGQPKMQFFAQDYALVCNDGARGGNVMKCFDRARLPVLSTLATQFAVADHWFSSVPGSTIPNRLFAHGAHSAGSLTQDTIVAPSRLKTIFEVVDDPANPATFRIYTSGASILMANVYLARHQSHFHRFSEFRNDCTNGDLPEYTFIEPAYDDDIANGTFANSQHPDFPVDEGEALIRDVYNAIRNSPMWPSTLLLIVYDEHGGIYDHVTPPTLVPDPNFPAVPASQDPAFTFNRLGVRVPAVFVSPFITAGTILSRQFDHCSIVSTVRKLFCLDKNPFNWREAHAAAFDDVLDRPANQMRQDRVVLPDPVSTPPATAAPIVKQPTDLMIDMVRAMQHTTDLMGLQTPMKVSQIYSSQDASNYVRDVAALLKIPIVALLCLLLPAPVRAQSMTSCPHAFSDIHQTLDCVEALFSERPIHLTLSSIPPGNGFPIGVVLEQVVHDVSSSGAKSVTDSRAAVVRSTNGSWYATAGLGWLPPLPYQDSQNSDGACHRLGPLCTRQVMSVDLSVSHRRLESLSFFGTGAASPDTRQEFKERETYGGAIVRMPIWNALRVEGQVEHRRPSVSGAFSEATAPGVSIQPAFMHYSAGIRMEATHISERPSDSAALAVAGADAPLMKRRIVYRFQNAVGHHWFSDMDTGRYSFRQIVFTGQESIELGSVLQRFVAPGSSTIVRLFCDGNKRTDVCEFGTIDVKSLITASQTAGGSVVPFYYQPTLGGSDIESRQTLRGFDNYRFRDATAALLQIEFGRPLFDPLGVFVFYDAGTVAPTFGQVSFSDMKQDTGVGVSVRLQGRVVVQAYVAAGAGQGARFGYNFEKFF
jgi:phospholipase C